MYACLGLSAVVFIIHGLLMYGWKTQLNRMSLDRMGLMALLNLTGAYTYAARVSYSCRSNDSSRANDDADTRKVVPTKIRHSGQQPPNTSCHGYFRGLSTHGRATASLSICTLTCAHLLLSTSATVDLEGISRLFVCQVGKSCLVEQEVRKQCSQKWDLTTS